MAASSGWLEERFGDAVEATLCAIDPPEQFWLLDAEKRECCGIPLLGMGALPWAEGLGKRSVSACFTYGGFTSGELTSGGHEG